MVGDLSEDCLARYSKRADSDSPLIEDFFYRSHFITKCPNFSSVGGKVVLNVSLPALTPVHFLKVVK